MIPGGRNIEDVDIQAGKAEVAATVIEDASRGGLRSIPSRNRTLDPALQRAAAGLMISMNATKNICQHKEVSIITRPVMVIVDTKIGEMLGETVHINGMGDDLNTIQAISTRRTVVTDSKVADRRKAADEAEKV